MKFEHFKFLVSILIASLMLTACQPGSGDKEPVSKAETPVRKDQDQPVKKNPADQAEQAKPTRVGFVKMVLVKDSDEVDPEINHEEFKKSLNHYTVKFILPAGLAQSVKLVRRFNGKSSDLNISVIDGESEDFIIDRIENEPKTTSYMPRDYIYDVYQGSELLTSFPVVLKADLLVEGIQSVGALGLPPGALFLNVIYLNTGARLITEGEDYTFSAEKLYAHNAVIETYSEQVAAKGTSARAAGKSGGKININVKSASGDLQVYLRGMKGGVGLPGENGKDGQNAGRTGQNSEVDHPDTCVHVEMPSDPKDVISFRRCSPAKSFCARQPGNGTDGDSGTNGTAGEDGFAGGDSGAFSIIAIQGETLNLHVDLVPGQGGAAGPAGKGGRGKPGGKAGSLFSPCKPAVDGKDGANGVDGASSIDGPAGNKNVYCIKLSENINQECF